MMPNGFFKKSGNTRGRNRLRTKIGPLFDSLEEMEQLMLDHFNHHDIPIGSDVVIMVVNDGELDLFLNFACSCREHGIELRNMMVFAGSR